MQGPLNDYVARHIQEDRRAEAEKMRLVANHDGKFERPARRPLYGPLLAQIGQFMIGFGEQLQERYSTIKRNA